MKNKLYSSWFKNQRNEPLAVGSDEGVLPFLKLIPKSKKKILVIGCGDGHEVAWFKKNNFSAIGITASEEEAKIGKKKFDVKILVKDMHDLGNIGKFDAVFASNVLEHSPMPYLALLHWRQYLNKNGWLVLVMPSREWLSEHYHLSVMTRSQMKDLLYKAGFKLLAGPQMKSKIDYRGGDIFYDLGRGWGFHDGYVSQLTKIPKKENTLDNKNKLEKRNDHLVIKTIRTVLKFPYNKIRQWYARNIRQW